MKDLLIAIAKALVDNPNEVKVNVIDGAHTTVLELSVAKEDIGKVIGKQGKNAQAIRTILNCGGKKLGKSVLVEIIE